MPSSRSITAAGSTLATGFAAARSEARVLVTIWNIVPQLGQVIGERLRS